MSDNLQLRPMQTAGLLNCRWCNADLRGKMINYNHFFHCSAECKQAERKFKLDKKLARNRKKTDALFASHSKPVEAPVQPIKKFSTPAPINIIKTAQKAPEAIKLNKDGTPRKTRVEKGPRVCGKCGMSGHNARTCKN